VRWKYCAGRSPLGARLAASSAPMNEALQSAAESSAVSNFCGSYQSLQAPFDLTLTRHRAVDRDANGSNGHGRKTDSSETTSPLVDVTPSTVASISYPD
jgi:hypothetical protein